MNWSITSVVGYAKIALVLLGAVAYFIFKQPIGEVTGAVVALSLLLSGVGFYNSQDSSKPPPNPGPTGRGLLSIVLMVCLVTLVISQSACSDSQIRANIKDAVSGAHSVARSVQFQLPAGDPRIADVQAFVDALDRFDAAFPAAKTDEDKRAVMVLFADAVTAFNAAVLPLLPLGGVLALGIVAADAALRILVNRLATVMRRVVARIEKRLTKSQLADVARCRGIVDSYLARQPAG